jgi:hypothetical protein
LDLSVESIEISAHLAASCSGVTGRDHAVNHRLAVLGLADLEVADAINARFDKVARGVDIEQAHGLALDLPAHDQAAVEVDAVLLRASASRACTLRTALPTMRATSNRLLAVQMVHGLAIGAFDGLAAQQLLDGLGDGQVARRQHHQHPIASRFSKTVILRKVLIWSMPALVRESDRNTSRH